MPTRWDRPPRRERVPSVRSAHLGDLTSCQSAGRFIWPNWIVRAHFTLLSSDPKIGKTHLALDLARRLWFGLTLARRSSRRRFPEETTTLWVCGDRHQDELRERAAAFGLPPEAVRLNALPNNPYGGWDLDDPDNVKLLGDLVASEQPRPCLHRYGLASDKATTEQGG